MVERGEIWWYEEPDSKRRPVLILTRSAALPVLNQVIGVPATTRPRGIPTEVEIGPDQGMPRTGVLTLDNLGPHRPALCTELITTLDDAHMRRVCEALATATDC